MRFHHFAPVLVLAVAAAHVTYYSVDEEWPIFKKKFDKSYHSLEVERKRISIFAQNVEYINAHNLKFEEGEEKFLMGINQFTDMTHSEVLKSTKCVDPSLRPTDDELDFANLDDIDIEDLPPEVDWRKKHAVTEVKDQGNCGSCWAFVTAGVLESHRAIKANFLQSLSPQEVMDCSWKMYNAGCHGGDVHCGLKWVIDNKGIGSMDRYPYKEADSICTSNTDEDPYMDWKGVKVLQSETDLLKAIATVGPVAVDIATSEKFDKADKYVFHDPSCEKNNITHSVLVVGYGTLNEDPYWIVKNSWGPAWADNGYLKMARNENTCNLTSFMTYPEGDKRERIGSPRLVYDESV